MVAARCGVAGAEQRRRPGDRHEPIFNQTFYMVSRGLRRNGLMLEEQQIADSPATRVVARPLRISCASFQGSVSRVRVHCAVFPGEQEHDVQRQ